MRTNDLYLMTCYKRGGAYWVTVVWSTQSQEKWCVTSIQASEAKRLIRGHLERLEGVTGMYVGSSSQIETILHKLSLRTGDF